MIALKHAQSDFRPFFRCKKPIVIAKLRRLLLDLWKAGLHFERK
jgi:hypothetical protein